MSVKHSFNMQSDCLLDLSAGFPLDALAFRVITLWLALPQTGSWRVALLGAIAIRLLRRRRPQAWTS